MTIVLNPAANPAHTTNRPDCDSPTAAPATPHRTLRRRLATSVRNAVRDRQPTQPISELVLSGIRNVHSVDR